MTTPRVTVPVEQEFAHYRRSQIAHLRPYVAGETLSDRVSISSSDLEAGSPKPGDMIARNPANHDDQWLVAADYFAANFEPVSAAPAPEGGAVWFGAKDYEPTDAMIDAGEYHNHRHNPLTNLVASFKAMMEQAEIDGLVSCAPALATREEAPAEDDARRKLIQCIEQWDSETEYDADDLTSLADSILHAFNGPPVVLRADPVQLSSNPCQLAVATSSEASPCPFCGCGMRVNYDPESEMYGPDGDHLPGCIIGNWDLHEYAFRPDALAAWNSRALRAQPQAREEAQPVHCHHEAYQGYCAHCGVKIVNGFAITPKPYPAPDALRVAVEVLEWYGEQARLARLIHSEGDAGRHALADDGGKRARQALAALQAEQKGGA